MGNRKITYVDMVINKKTNYDESIDAIVPDLYPDISKIIGVTATAFIKDNAVQNDRILISGDLHCDLCYIPEGEMSPVIMKVVMSFAHIEQAVIENLVVNCNININKIEARIINPRKVSLLANVCINTKAYKDAEICLSELNDDGYQMLHHQQSLNLIDTVNTHEFILTDNLEFKGIISNEYEIYGVKANVIVNDTKILKNKLMIRGNVNFCGTLVDEYDMTEISTSVAFSQIIDINIKDETLDTNIEICIKSFDIENISGAEFSFSLCVKTCITQSKTEIIPIVLDIYDVKHKILVNSKSYMVLDTPKSEYEKCEFNVLVPCENIIDSVLHAECQTFTKLNENSNIECFARFTGIYKSGKEYYDFEHEQVILKDCEFTDIEFKNTEMHIISGNEINLRMTVDTYKYNDKKVKVDVIENITREEEHEKINNTIILKYISSETKLWDIAKKYNTTVLDIISSNSLDSNTFKINDTMLLIPVK